MEINKKPKRPRIGESQDLNAESGRVEKVTYNPNSAFVGETTANDGTSAPSTDSAAKYRRNYNQNNYQRNDYNNYNNRYGRNNNRQGGYNNYNNRQGGYNNYNNRQQNSFNNESQDNFNEFGSTQQQSTETYNNSNNNNRQGGYNNNRQGGYNNYNNNRQGGYNNRQGGYNNYNNNRQGGYNNRQGGYNNFGGNNNRQGGYNNFGGGNNRQGGYNNFGGGNNRQGGYNNRQQNNRQGGYNNFGGNNRQGGFNNRQQNRPQAGKRFTPRPKQVIYEMPEMDPNEETRLNKFMANAGICSRREADELIQQGLVKVNGVAVTELGTKIKRDDVVEYQDKVVTLENKAYILLNKPKDCVTTSDDPDGRLTVMDIVKNACKERIYPVGRLDRNTTGVLLLTNDGDLASKLTHPKYIKKKIYHVWTDKDIAEDDMQRLADGIELEDGPIHADAISYVNDHDKNQAGIEIHSGRNRIVRRMFESLGYRVTKLDRVYFAGLTKKNLPRGRWRYLTQEEVNFLKQGSFE